MSYSTNLPEIVFGFTAIATILWLFDFIHKKSQLLNAFPLVFITDDQVFSQELTNAVNKYPVTPFHLNAAGSDAIILPYCEVEHIRNLPENVASFKDMIYEMTEARYTGARDTPHQAIEAIGDLTRHMAVLDALQDEVRYIIDHHVETAHTWTKINIPNTAIKIIGGMTERIFVGLPLCRDREWLEASITFPGDLIRSILTLQAFHFILRPFVSIFSAQLRKLRSYRKLASQKLAPHIETTRDEPHLVNWILKRYDSPTSVSALQLGMMLMNLGTAAIDTSSFALQHIMIDLASYSQYIPELREEIEKVLREESDGQLHKTSIPKLEKLDSFMKESQRLNPPIFLNINRKVTATKGLRLSTGEIMPRGTLFGFAHPYSPGAKARVSKLYNDKDQPPFNQFAPWRYYNLRKVPGEESKHQFVTLSADSPIFGIGPQACPGRFFATDLIKVALVELLRRYEFAIGEKGENATVEGFSRPASIPFRTGALIDPHTSIYVHERTY